MTSTKVVRVEDVLDTHHDPGTTSPMGLLSGGGEGSTGDVKPPTTTTEIPLKTTGETGSRSTLRSREIENDESSYFTGSESEEAKEKVYEMPANWPRIKQLDRPFSCKLSMSRMPCVRKAVSHLELIQNIIEEWFKRAVDEARSRSSTATTTSFPQTPEQHVPRKHLRFRDPSASTSRTAITSMEDKSPASSGSLTVNGLGIDVPDPEAENQYSQELGGISIPYLGAEDVIDEVLTLLARLETDRQDTVKKLSTECGAGEHLKKKIEELCLRRLKELPGLVQREHEACVVDLNELHWHVAYTSRALDRAKERKEHSESANLRLKEEISFIKQHIPLVQEKLVLELEAMDRIKKAQVETNQELMTTKQRQAKTEQKSTEAMSKAETERGHIKRELDTVRDNLNQISEELSEAKMAFNSYVHQVNDIGQQLQDNAQELEVLLSKEKNAKEAEALHASKVRALQAKITDAEFEFRRLENENVQAKEHLALLVAKNAAKLKEYDNKCKVLEERHRVLKRANEQLQIEIEDLEQAIQECDDQKIKDDKNIRRIQRELEKVKANMAVTMDEYEKVSSINRHIREQLTQEQEKAFRAEEQLKNTAETLRRQVKEEVHTRTVLQARINSDKAEMDKTRGESAKKQAKADKVAHDVEQAVEAVQDKVEKLRTAKIKREEQKTRLAGQIEETKKQHAESLAQFEARLASLTPHYNKLKLETNQLTEQLDKMKHQSDVMNKKIEDMDAAEKVMHKVVHKTEKAVTQLESELLELQKQLDTNRWLTDSLKTELTSIQDRLKDGEQRQSRLILDRTAVLMQHDGEIRKCVDKNKELAARYRRLQNEFLVTKEQLLRSFDNRLKFESTIGDVKQLKALQSKLHGALAEYFKLSGLYNEGELSRLEHISNVNGSRVCRLQDDMEDALSLITNFLQTEMDGTKAREMAWEAMHKMKKMVRSSTTRIPGSSSSVRLNATSSVNLESSSVGNLDVST